MNSVFLLSLRVLHTSNAVLQNVTRLWISFHDSSGIFVSKNMRLIDYLLCFVNKLQEKMDSMQNFSRHVHAFISSDIALYFVYDAIMN